MLVVLYKKSQSWETIMKSMGSSFIRLIMVSLVSGASPVVGSSSKINLGSIAIIVARESNFFSPPESLVVILFSFPASPTMSSAHSAFFLASLGDSPRLRGPKATSSSTVGEKKLIVWILKNQTNFFSYP